MAGVKGRSGGKRPNAGRKKDPSSLPPVMPGVDPATGEGAPVFDPVLASDGTVVAGPREPLKFLEDVLNMPNAPLKDRIRAAIAAAQYKHTKLHDGGKKDAKADAAKKAAAGRFGSRPAPLKLVGGA